MDDASPAGGREDNDAYVRALGKLLLQVPIITFAFDRDLRLRRFGGGGFPRPDLDRSALIGCTAAEVVGPIVHAGEFLAMLRRCLEGASERRTLQAATRWYDTIVEPTRIADGSIVGVQGVALNVSPEVDARTALAATEANLARASRIANVAWWHYDIVRAHLTFSDFMLRTYRLDPGVKADREGFLSLVHPDDHDRVRKSLIVAQRDGTSSKGEDYRIRKGDGGYRWVFQQIEVLAAPDGRPAQMHGTLVDITERKELEEHLRRLAHIDGLTGLANRAWLGERLAETFARYTVEPKALLYIDVDGFKSVNDTYGHGVGDDLLKEVARRIKSCLRADDFVARSGGDEFVVLIAPAGDEDGAIAALAERLVATCAKPYAVEHRELFTSISIGVSIAPNDANDPDALLRSADSALYAAKLAGRNTHRFFTTSMHLATARQLTLENDLRRAIERGQLFIEYQPIVHADGTVATIEALARWRHPDFGLVEPSVFIPIAEESGAIAAIGTYLAAQACCALRAWRMTDPALRLALNISGYQLDHEELLPMLATALAEAGLDYGALDLEVTETVVMRDVERAAETLRSLKNRGARISIDDFGTGYSSLSLLKRLPIDTIKIDRSFVSDIVTDREDFAIVGSIVSLANALSLDVVAEGIEERAQFDTLVALGCRQFQGYAFSRPVAAVMIPPTLRRLAENGRQATAKTKRTQTG